MDHILTIRSTPPEGGLVEIVVEIFAADKATLTIRKWAKDSAGPPAAPDRVEPHTATDIRLAKNGLSIACQVSIAKVTCGLSAEAIDPPTVTVETQVIWHDTKDVYPITPEQRIEIAAFFKSAGFPSA